ncbi:MAG: cation-translocating P-type ATPase [Ruminococcaceae bacterium]|nr:cation-translocating P-type ATPase [Oscillospiraceae bacterium]
MSDFRNDFSVDDILEEIRRKKAGEAPPPPPVREEPPLRPAETPPAPATPAPPPPKKAEPREEILPPQPQTEPEELEATRSFVPVAPPQKPAHILEPPEDEEEAPLRERRKSKVLDFVLNGTEEENDSSEEPEEEPGEPEIIDDYNSPEDAESVQEEIAGLSSRMVMRMISVALPLLAAVYLSFGPMVGLPLPEILTAAGDPFVHICVQLGLLVVAALICHVAVGEGIISLVTFKADSDSLLSVALIGNLFQLVYLLFTPEALASPNLHIYTPIVILGMFLNSLGKLFLVRRVAKNFALVSTDRPKFTLSPLSPSLSKPLTAGALSGEPFVFTRKKTGFLKSFLDESYTPDPCDAIARILAPVSVLGAIAVAVGSYVVTQDIPSMLTAAAATVCVCSPLSGLLAANLPLLRATSAVHKEGGVISGFAACDHLYDANAVALRSSDLLPAGSVQLMAIKTFGNGRIDEVIMDAASVLCNSDDTLKALFMGVINGDERLLKPVDTVLYEEGMGISAWVNGKRVLIGSRDLMLHHGVDVPSRDYEERYLRSGANAIYLSNAGELIAAFLVTYQPDEAIRKQVERCAAAGILLLISTTDPNITTDKFCQLFDVRPEAVRIVPAHLHQALDRESAESETEPVGISAVGGPTGLLHTLLAAISARRISFFSAVLQTVAVVLGYGLIAFLAFLSGISQLTLPALMLYELFWLAVVTVIPLLRRY